MRLALAVTQVWRTANLVLPTAVARGRGSAGQEWVCATDDGLAGQEGKARGDNGRGAYLARDKNDIFGDWVNDSLLEPSCHLDEYSLEFNVFYSFFNRTECLCALIS